jgi:twitching motility two-component system response regulator PilH
VVEDDRALQTYYKSALTLAGYGVITADDGLEALQRVEGHHPSAVVLDLGLPRLSGQDVGRELAAHPDMRDIPIVVVTGDTGAFDLSQFACVLRKPVGPDALIAAIEDCLNRAI